jgi:hypothetical protein
MKIIREPKRQQPPLHFAVVPFEFLSLAEFKKLNAYAQQAYLRALKEHVEEIFQAAREGAAKPDRSPDGPAPTSTRRGS